MTDETATVSLGLHGVRPCVALDDGNVEVVVLLGGGHIAALHHFRNTSGLSSERSLNALWTPPWPTADPSCRRLTVAVNEDAFRPDDAATSGSDPLESEMLACIAGHSLCFDVFGAHSLGEVTRAGMSFHGEAGLVTWSVMGVEDAAFTVGALLPQSQLGVRRRFSVRRSAADPAVSVVRVCEKIQNMTGIQRALGRAQHVSIGSEFLQGGARFASNASRGAVWPDADAGCVWSAGAEFDYPAIPRTDGCTDDWRVFPRQLAAAGGICTLRIDPSATHGWFVAARDVPRGDSDIERCDVLAYRWRRADFPFLVTWEEDRSRSAKPWRGVTTVRGLEFSSYALPKGRRWNVERGTVLGAPSFEWLDAHEEKGTVFEVVFMRVDGRPAASVVAEETVAAECARWFADEY